MVEQKKSCHEVMPPWSHQLQCGLKTLDVKIQGVSLQTSRMMPMLNRCKFLESNIFGV